MKISYFVKPNRTILMARVYVNGKPKDKSTGISIIGNQFDFATKRFKNKSPEALRLNMLLNDFEQQIYKKILTGNEITSVRSGNSADITLSSLLDLFEARLNSGKILNSKTGRPLSEETIRTLNFDVNFLRGYLKKESDLNFSLFNATTPGAQRQYSDFIASLKAYMSDLDSNTASNYMMRFKTMITRMCKLQGIQLGSLLDEMNINKTEKPVIILDTDQLEFVLNNYDNMVEDCQTYNQRTVMQYWLAAIVLNARKLDMILWTDKNLYEKDGQTWIQYIPHKNKSRTGKSVNVPVYDERLVNIFKENARKFKGKLLPPMQEYTSMTVVMKIIARRYPIFHREIQLQQNGDFVKVRMCDYIKMHQMRASGASDKVMRGVPAEVVKQFTGHTANSKSWARYLEVLPSSTQKYISALAAGTSVPPQTEAKNNSHHTS